MPSKIVHIILLLACIYIPLLNSEAKKPPQTDDNLKEIINRVATDITFRNLLEIHDHLLVEEFYATNQYRLQWFTSFTDISKREKLAGLISEPEKYMLDPGRYHLTFITSTKILSTKKDTLYAELKFTDAALCFIRDIAYTTTTRVKYNGWKYQPDCISITYLLQQALITGDFENSIKEAEPENIQYRILRSAYQQLYAISIENNFREIVVADRSVNVNNKNLVYKLKQLGYMGMNDTSTLLLSEALIKFQQAHNLPVQNSISRACNNILNESVKEKLKELRWNIKWYRWLSCMQNKSYILVNIAANRISFFECNQETFQSKIVVGKISTPSPTLTSAIKNVIYYPYWNIPFSIATKEMLPKLKRNPYYLDALKIEVLQGGHIYGSSSDIDWDKYSARNFPFSFRQLPGCDNSLGLLKFDFENPFHVYLHDTNNKSAFRSGRRFFSHGCIRIEKPYELALALGITADQVNMDSCLTGMKPQVMPLNRSIPVFIIYSTVDIIDGELRWFEDAYHKREN